jgi:hypothetical protein
VSATMLGLEIATRLLRSNLIIGLRVESAAPHGPAQVQHPHCGSSVHSRSDSHEGQPTQDELERRAYERWERAGRPEGWDKEFYRMAELELRSDQSSSLDCVRTALHSPVPRMGVQLRFRAGGEGLVFRVRPASWSRHLFRLSQGELAGPPSRQ